MKSYFAKLAARATLTNETATAAVNATKLADPFEQTSLPQPPLSPPVQLSPGSEKVRPRSEVSTTPAPEPLDHATTLLPKPPSAFSSAERTPNSQFDIPRSKAADAGRQTEQTERQTTEPGTRGETPLPLTPPVALSPPHLPTTSGEAGKSPFTESERTEDQIAEMKREQVVLLRKADAFMERLLDRRLQSTSNAETDASDTAQSKLKPKAVPDQTPRLLPVQAAPRQFEPESDQPSLVIGKLTVEVVPPAQEPATPRQQVVVVRGTRGGRNGIPSSRRFGLAQF